MPAIKAREDIKPLSKFRANVKQYLERVRKTHRPLVITQRGEIAGVMVSMPDYQRLVYLREKEVLRKIIRKSRAEIAAGRSFTIDEAVAIVKKRLRGGDA